MDTLVLDVGYRPMARVSWETAIVWVLEKVVEVVDEHPDRYINTVSWQVKMPSVVRMLRSVQKKRAIKFSRHNIYARDKGKCQYCGMRVAREEFTYEHVTPRAQGGKTSWENVVVACVGCNQRKGGRTPAQAGMRLLSTPVRPKTLHIDTTPRVRFEPGMPKSWEQWLRSSYYWDGSLEQD